MRSLKDIADLLPELDQVMADALEDQDLDFKQWDGQSRDKAVKLVVHMAVCMANGGGGTVVFGVADKVVGRQQALPGVPPEIDVNLLKKAVYDQTDPKITPHFENLTIPEGTGRLLLMQIYPGLPPHTDTAGRGTVRVGKECQPLTGSLRRKIAVETGETDYTAETVGPFRPDGLSASALEVLRDLARVERAPEDLLRLNDQELLTALGVVRDSQLTRAALLLGGHADALSRYVPGHNWTFLQMKSDTEYGIREDRTTAIPQAVQRIEDLLVPFNPITTLELGLFHFEYRTWPAVAVREALMNAFCHLDLRIPGPVMVKLYPDRLEISNNGGFIAGISEHNILHHTPAARNPLLVEALTRLRLINRSNLGVSRMYSALLMEGKPPPVIHEIGDSIQLSLYRHELSPAFRLFVAEESRQGRDLNVDTLLILRHLLRHLEIETAKAAQLCQRTEPQMREHLASMERAGYIEHGGSGRGAYWTLRPALHRQLAEPGHPERDRRIDWEAAKARILSILMERARRGEGRLSNKEIRLIAHFDRNQVTRLMKELRDDHPQVISTGHGAGAGYIWSES